MDYLLARVSDRKNSYRKIFSGQATYQIPDTLANCIKYTPEDTLDEEEWFYVEKFSTTAFCIELLKQNFFNSTDYATIKKIGTEKINYIVAYQQENIFLFQRVYVSSILQKKKFIHFGDDIEIRECEYGIIVNEVPDAIYMKDKDCLYFKKLEAIAPIFKEIDALYREATDDEVKLFLNNDFVCLIDEFDAASVKKSNRKRIALAMQILSSFSNEQKQDVFQYTNDYYPDLKFDGDKFEIKDETDLKNLLYGIEQRYYTTPVTHEKRCASGVRVIEKV